MKRVSILLLLVTAAFAQTRSRLAEYALVLEDPPVAQKAQSRAALQSAEAQAHLQKVRGAQRSVLAELAARKVRVASTSQILVNAVFVRVTQDQVAAIQHIPGVKWIQYLPPSKPALNAAVNLIGVPFAWSTVGGSANAGAGVRIGIIDTGIDQNHPGFKDTGFTPPAGFPKGDTGYTNNKVIVARSYVSMLENSSDPTISTPDDLSPRDRQGHGTAIAMIAAGVQNAGPLATITGVAPKAFLGNYKVFGSPGVNEYTYRSAWIQALTDAVTRWHGYRHALARRGRPGHLRPARSRHGSVRRPGLRRGRPGRGKRLQHRDPGGRGGRQRRQYRLPQRESQFAELAGRGAERDRGGGVGEQSPGVPDRARQRQQPGESPRLAWRRTRKSARR